MKKRLLIGIIASAIFSVPVAAEVVPYEDEYVSFEYDDEVNARISRTINGTSDYCPLMYIMSFQMNKSTDAPAVDITLYAPDDGFFESLMKRDDVTVLSEDPLELIFENENGKNYRRIIAKQDGYVLEVNLHVPEEETKADAVAQKIYDTASAGPDLWEQDLSAIDWESINVYKNVIYSEDAIALAGQAVNICDGYLNMTVTAEEAGKRMKSVFSAAEDLKSNSDYPNDSDLYYALYSSERYFGACDDAAIMNMQTELKDLLGEQDID